MTSLDLDRGDHVDLLRRAYARFPQIGQRTR